MIVGGKGLWVEDATGKRYLDACSGGAAVSCLGHGDQRVAEAIAGQLDRIAYYHNSFFTSQPAEELGEALLADAPAGLSRVMFASGGSEAMEAALKLARQYWVECGREKKRRVIARRQSYHGASLGALAVGGNAGRRQPYLPLLADTHFIAPCYAYRHQAEDESEMDYGRRAADELERAILELGAENVMAFVAEPVVGASLGAVPAVSGYLRRVREICDRHDVLLIFDEIMCGSGRTGVPYACLEDGASPDILTVAKGLGGGYQPVGAVLVAERIVEAIADGSGALKHGYTYMAHPVACAAALAVQRIVADDGLLDNVTARGIQLRNLLRERLADHPHVGDIRGRGLFVGVELVADRDDKSPFDPALTLHARLKAECMRQGLLIYPGGGTVDGKSGDHALFAPAYTVTAAEIEEIVARFELCLNATLKAVERET